MYRHNRYHIHFVGIGGIGMSGIAEVLLNLGYTVSGSDIKTSDTTRRLQALGCNVYEGHAAENIRNVDTVVVSSAVLASNPEVQEARRRKLPIIPRAEMLAELMRLKIGVAVAGSHGKTTTTSLIATILAAAHLDPTTVVGGKLNQFGSNARLGSGEYLVAEADESDGSFLHLSPTIAVVTNVDREHMNYFHSLEVLGDAFIAFINKIPFYGLAVICVDHSGVQALIPRIEKRFVTYGFSSLADYRASHVVYDTSSTRFVVYHRGHELGVVHSPLLGEHNVLNCLAAIAVAGELQIPTSVAFEAIQSFAGVARRFQVKGVVQGVTVIDDYGHHPAEIATTIRAARLAFEGRRIIIFQPHRYTRTKDLFDEFATCFNDAGKLFVLDIYPAGEPSIPGITGRALWDAIVRHGHQSAEFAESRETLLESLREILAPGDIVMTFGAGDIATLGEEIIRYLASHSIGGSAVQVGEKISSDQ